MPGRLYESGDYVVASGHRASLSQTVGVDCWMPKKYVKSRPQMADKIGAGFNLPESISPWVGPTVSRMSSQELKQVVAVVHAIRFIVFLRFEMRAYAQICRLCDSNASL